MPLLRQSLYSQNVNLYLAPTADARDTWLSLMRTVGCESRAFVLSANQCVRRKDLPEWILRPPEKPHGQIPASVEAGSSDAIEEAQHRPNNRRRSTTISVEDDHEIALPAVESRLDSSVQQQDSTVLNGDSKSSATRTELAEGAVESKSPANGSVSAPKARRKSTITKTPDRHQICWPVDNDDIHTTAIESPPVTKSGPLPDHAGDEFVCRGGSCIVSPFGDVLAGPLWDIDNGELLIVDADFEDCERGRLDLDLAGSYSRNESFKLSVDGLDLNPPP